MSDQIMGKESAAVGRYDRSAEAGDRYQDNGGHENFEETGARLQDGSRRGPEISVERKIGRAHV